VSANAREADETTAKTGMAGVNPGTFCNVFVFVCRERHIPVCGFFIYLYIPNIPLYRYKGVCPD